MPSEEVTALLRAHVASYEHLAVLLLIQREPARAWSTQDLSSRLEIALPLVEAAAADLCAAGLLRSVSGGPAPEYQYAATSGKATAVANLAREYTQNPLGIIQLLSANAIQRMRTSALRAFADAFVLKKKDRDSG